MNEIEKQTRHIINILIVDDEPKNLTVLEAVLDNPGYRLVRAHSAEQALLALVSEEFALLILDIRMPDMTGFELAQTIKERKKNALLPIIFLTAYYNEDQHVLEGYGTGAVDYLHKPVNATILRSKVAVFAELHRKNRVLLAEVTERRRADEELRELNATLEQRVTDRTEALKLALNTLKDNDRHKDEFLAMLAHELRNPLVPIRNALAIWKRGAAGKVAEKDIQAIMDRQLQKIVRLVDDLLDISRITRGVIVLERDSVDLTLLVSQAVEEIRHQFEERQHEVSLSLPTAKVFVLGDAVRIEQVVSNLLTNAVKYTERGGRITVALEREKDNALIRITDNGVGISPDLLPYIFDLFVQAERSLDRTQGGLGIGLTLVQRLVELHGGTVEAKSEGLKKGSEFIVRLPVISESEAVFPVTSPVASQKAPERRILIIEDNVDSAKTIQMLLELQGHRVQAAFDGLSGIEAAKIFKPEVILLDIGLPGMDGYEVAKRLRKLPETEKVLLIAFSGYGQAEDLRKSKEAGFDHHLIKPADMDQLLALIMAAPHITK